VVTPGAKTREQIRTHNGSKRVKSGKDVPFGGFVKIMVTHTPTSPQILKILHYRSGFSLKTRINLRNPHQISYSNRKQSMGISNFRLKI